MWKKFLAVTAILALFSTSAFALGGQPEPDPNAPQSTSYIDNFAITPASFDPNNGQTAVVSFDLSQAMDVYAYVINSNSEIVTVFSNYQAEPAGATSYTWYGTTNNTAGGTLLPDGDYTAKVFAAETGNVKDADFGTVTISTSPVVNPDAPQVSNLSADPLSFSPQGNDDTEISFDVNKGSNITVEIEDASTNDTVKTFTDYNGDYYQSTEDHSINWDGRNDSGNQVTVGTYTVEVTVTNDDGSNTASLDIEVTTKGVLSDGVIRDLKLDPSNTWDPTDEELEIDFELDEDVKSLVIEAKKGNKVIEIIDDEYADDDDYEENWDGTDDDGDYVAAGTWEIIVRADGDKVSDTIKVEYEKPEITEAFVTKSSFDPDEDEFTYLIFKVDADAEVSIDVYDGSKKEVELWDEVEVNKNDYYAVKWDGTDDDGDEVDEGKSWKFKITAENPTEDDEFDTDIVEVDVEDDDVSDKKSNVTNDYIDPAIFDEDDAEEATISYCLDADAEVSIEIFEGKSTSGKSETELLDFVDHEKGCHSISFALKDDKGKDLHEDIYSYKIISKANGSHKDTEVGRFVIGDTEDDEPTPTPTPDPLPTPTPTPTPTPEPPVFGACSNYYWDVSYLSGDNELCEAIAWATEQGIFSGYPDGSFKPYDTINRAEVLKVVFEAFDNVSILGIDGTNLGFGDVDPYAWYMPYVRTAVYNGMLHGYNNGTEARLSNNVNRVELLKFVLEASQAFTGFEFVSGYYYPGSYADVPYNSDTSWFYDYANAAYTYDLYDSYFVGSSEYLKPEQNVQRGEVALLLYRMEQAGLLDNSYDDYYYDDCYYDYYGYYTCSDAADYYYY